MALVGVLSPDEVGGGVEGIGGLEVVVGVAVRRKSRCQSSYSVGHNIAAWS